ncbi:MAG TPA: tyrosine-protein phosphatase [Acidimicrobiia bacterium]|jgi:protein tyrosine/serine phosphatase
MVLHPMSADRVIRLEGCFNLRDVGGYSALDGQRVRWQRLYRAGGPHALTPADGRTLDELHLATLIDLRTEQERVERGVYTSYVNVRGVHHLPILDVLPSREDFEGWTSPDRVAFQYLDMLRTAGPVIAEALAFIADPGGGPVMVHCTAGKDRTGVVIALVLGLLGVSDDDIVADYALSEIAMHEMVAFFESQSDEAREALAPIRSAVIAASPETMRTFLAGLRATYGSPEGYAAAMKITPLVAQLRTSLLA